MANTITIGVKELYVFELDTDCTILTGGKGFRTCSVKSTTPFELSYEDAKDLTSLNTNGKQCGPKIKVPSFIRDATGTFTLCGECPDLLGFLLGYGVATYDADPTVGIGIGIDVGNGSCDASDLVDKPKVAMIYVESYRDASAGLCNPSVLGAKVTLIGAATDFKLNNSKAIEEGGSRFDPEIMYEIYPNPAFVTPGNEPADIFAGISGAWTSTDRAIYEGFIDAAGYATLQTLANDCTGFATPAGI